MPKNIARQSRNDFDMGALDDHFYIQERGSQTPWAGSSKVLHDNIQYFIIARDLLKGYVKIGRWE